jgi:hypothetical protein
MMRTVRYILDSYKPFDGLEQRDLEIFRDFVLSFGDKTDRIYDRSPGQSTITASAVVINPECSKILIMHHKLHGFYKQFGGHADGNQNLPAVAADELFQESGAHGKLLMENPLDLIRWNFPERTKGGKFYPAHDNFDIAFLFLMDEGQKLKRNEDEALDIKWCDLDIWRDYSDMENPTYLANPQNIDYQRRIYAKVKQFSKV